MSTSANRERSGLSREWAYHLAICAAALVALGWSIVGLVGNGDVGWRFAAALLIGVPLIALIARFPMVLDGGGADIGVAFDSSILMFLLCTLDGDEAVIVWAAGVLLTQGASNRRASARLFNVGVGVTAGVLAAMVYGALNPGADVQTPRGLAAVALAAVAYFLADYVLSALSVAISSRTSLHTNLAQAGVPLAIACFVPLDSLGYLGAVVVDDAPIWMVTLLVVPLVTLLIATRAVTRGRENARRLTVLFEAAVRAQSLPDRGAVLAALLRDAGALLRSHDLEVRAAPPAVGEIGARVQLGEQTRWLVTRGRDRARSTVAADEQALRALAAVASDAIARLELTEEMVHVARHDPLTDLPNRGILLDRVTQALEHTRAAGTQAALLFVDLDGFKPVNDRFGHTTGDLVLVQIAGRLRECVREHDTIARLGGDEFAVLVEDIDPADVPQLCERMIAAVEAAACVGGQPVRVGASVGIAYDRGHDTAASLLRNADMAMYEAKAQGKGRYVEYRAAMGRSRLERLELIDDLRGAVENDDLEVAYQPVVDVGTRRIKGAEALVRWCRNGTYVPPDVFISIAEETGLIVALGEAVLRRVSQDAAQIRAAGGMDRTISVNISAGQLREPGFIDTVACAVEAMGGTPLVLEITERQGVDLTGDVLAAMRAIGDMGVRFAIDDFGVGFSSISYLYDLPAQVIKADAALSQKIDRDERARGLLRSVLLMGSSLGFEVVVEGIERDSQYDVLLQDAPEAAAQGYLMYRPMPLERLIDVLAAERLQSGPRRWAPSAGFEPATPGTGNQCSIP